MLYRILWQSVFPTDGSVNIYILLALMWLELLILCQAVQTIFPPSWMWVGPLFALTNRPQKYTVEVLLWQLPLPVSWKACSGGSQSQWKNHKWCLKYLLLVRSQAMSLCFTNSLKTLLQPPCLRLAIEATKLQGTISWFFMPISTWN